MNAILDFIGIKDTDAQELIKASVQEQNIDMMREQHKDEWCAVSGEIENIGESFNDLNQSQAPITNRDEDTVIDFLTNLEYFCEDDEEWREWSETLFIKRKGGCDGVWFQREKVDWGTFVRKEGDQKQRDTYLKCCSEMIH